MKKTSMIALACAGMLGMMLPQQAKASEWNQKTRFTFSGPVEIPGQVLQAGTYVFKLADSMSDRDIVEVFSKNEKHLYGIFLAIPDYRLRPTGKTILTFEERASGSPGAVRAWFYPGENYGHEFVYPKVKAAELAKANNQNVASMPNELAANTTQPTQQSQAAAVKQAPISAQKPTGEEIIVAEAFPPANNQPAEKLPKKLPTTASNLPLVGLIGLLSLGTAGLLRCVDAKSN
jgi:hypothetical protein